MAWNNDISLFHPAIDLFDETLREGAERAPVATSIADKCTLARAIAGAGTKTIVVGMFPDVPHNIELLGALLDEQKEGLIPAEVRFVVISHLGITMDQSLAALDGLGRDLDRVWVLAIHAASDEQVKFLYPTIVAKDGQPFDRSEWEARTVEDRRSANLEWYQAQLVALKPLPTQGGFIAGFIDAFRADVGHMVNALGIASANGIGEVRLIDTAGTCVPEQARVFIGDMVREFPAIRFYGHFHDDFGMASANAVTGLSVGLCGADVTIGGFANRAGHPATAEVVMALRQLYGIELPGYRIETLYELSRLIERIYCLLESPANAVTGIVTHAVQSGIRTELLNRSPRIFDNLDPADVGSEEIRMFGVRSGQDGLLRILREHEAILAADGIEVTPEFALRLYDKLVEEWELRSERAKRRLLDTITAYQRALYDAFFTEAAVLGWVRETAPSLKGVS
ncbi:MAG: homocitrate synthase [Jatrophihabitantaceae bacterium]